MHNIENVLINKSLLNDCHNLLLVYLRSWSHQHDHFDSSHLKFTDGFDDLAFDSVSINVIIIIAVRDFKDYLF